MKNILIISSDYTGHGHKSISEALKEQFLLNDDVTLHIIDGFELGGNMWMKVGKSYGLVTRNAAQLWKLAWKISKTNPVFIQEFTELTIKNNFLKLLKRVNPDLILSVHPVFNTPVINILRSSKIDIPFAIFIADLVSISPLWADSRADCIICPTEEAKQKCLDFDVPERSIRVIGFPVRARFTEHVKKNPERNNAYSIERPLECLVMSGGEGSGDMSTISKVLLDNFNSNITIIAGRNATLKDKLEKTLSIEYPGRVRVLGYVTNIQDYMLGSDIAITRGSPNVMMECVACNVPIVITSALPGQEQENPSFAVKNKLGIYCPDIGKLAETISYLLSNDAYGLNEIKNTQRQFFDHDAAKKIVDCALDIVSMARPKQPIEHKRGKRKKILFKIRPKKIVRTIKNRL